MIIGDEYIGRDFDLWLLFIAVLAICVNFFSCKHQGTLKVEAETFSYGTSSDSARQYFIQGWEEILDNGRWTLSETYFRKAITIDPDFIIGKILVGRISGNLRERLSILEELERDKEKLSKDERLLLDVYSLNILIMNEREQEGKVDPDVIRIFRTTAESNFRSLVHKYPKESYIKAEYIEGLHAGYGAQVALDSLKYLATDEQKNLPFYIGYTALMKAELGEYNAALEHARRLSDTIYYDEMPATDVLYAEIYFRMDSLDRAKNYIQRAVKSDPRHLIAQGLKRKIENKLQGL